MICNNCPHKCDIKNGFNGVCKTRDIKDGKIISLNYGKVTSLALDPIEKKPLKHFMPGSYILSAGFWGCNLKCPWCQNDSISRGEARSIFISPEELVHKALTIKDNIGIAYTYNEPLISLEFVKETAELACKKDLKNVLVTNGMVSEDAFAELIPFIDALNVDLKTIDPQKYKSIGGDLDAILKTIETSSKTAHVEATTLLVPGFNDDEKEMRELAKTLAQINKNIVLHVTRFFPAGEMLDAKPTSVQAVYAFADIAREYLNYVYEGNV